MALVIEPAGLVRVIDWTKGAIPDELTALNKALPLRAALLLSATVNVWFPGVLKVLLNRPAPLVSVVLLGKIA